MTLNVMRFLIYSSEIQSLETQLHKQLLNDCCHMLYDLRHRLSANQSMIHMLPFPTVIPGNLLCLTFPEHKGFPKHTHSSLLLWVSSCSMLSKARWINSWKASSSEINSSLGYSIHGSRMQIGPLKDLLTL